jgi:hypothetical protein
MKRFLAWTLVGVIPLALAVAGQASAGHHHKGHCPPKACKTCGHAKPCGHTEPCCCHPCACNTLMGNIAYRGSQLYSWHGNYFHPAYGAPVALVVPPTAGRQTDYHWGVAGYRTTPIYHQFKRGFPGYGIAGPSFFLPTPRWPSDTNQLGVYYVRGPW